MKVVIDTRRGEIWEAEEYSCDRPEMGLRVVDIPNLLWDDISYEQSKPKSLDKLIKEAQGYIR